MFKTAFGDNTNSGKAYPLPIQKTKQIRSEIKEMLIFFD
jgi:hypothetical protein